MSSAPDPIQVRYLRTPSGRARIDLSVESPDAIYNRFDDPACGGTSHGDTSHLSSSDIDALVTFLETL